MNYRRLGLRAAYGLILDDLSVEDKNFFVGACDTSTSAGLDRFRKNNSKQYIELGIGEQNAIGVGAAIASEGYPIFISSFAPFIVLRAFEQIKIMLGYDANPVCIVGLASGLVQSVLGQTHCCLEDIGALNCIPNLEIYSPINSYELENILKEYKANPRPTYIRLTGDTNLYEKDDFLELDKLEVSKLEKNKLLILSTGAIYNKIYEAITGNERVKKSSTLIHVTRIKPFNFNKLNNIKSKFDKIVTIEEHNINSGLGSIVSNELIKHKNPTQLIKFGVDDTYKTIGGSYEQALEANSLSTSKLNLELTKLL